jgi:hypothetical protein
MKIVRVVKSYLGEYFSVNTSILLLYEAKFPSLLRNRRLEFIEVFKGCSTLIEIEIEIDKGSSTM